MSDGTHEHDKTMGLFDPMNRAPNAATSPLIVHELRAEVEQLQVAKRRALAIADERSKENVELRAENERLRATLDRLQAASNNKEISGSLWDKEQQCYMSLPMFFGRLNNEQKPDEPSEVTVRRERSEWPDRQT